MNSFLNNLLGSSIIFLRQLSSLSTALVFAMSLLILSCNQTLLDEIPLNKEYFPLEEGSFRIYDVDSILYHETIDNDTSHWQVMEQINSSYTDLEGMQAFRIDRFRRADESEGWQPAGTWSARITDRAEKTENNLNLIKLVFPPENGVQWAGNILLGALETEPVSEQCNSLDFLYDWTYEYADVHMPFSINSGDFDSTLTVHQFGERNLVEFNQATEVYAKGIGLVWQKFEHYTTQQICATCPWEEKAECGFRVELELTDWN